MNGSFFVFIQLLLEDQRRLHVFGGLDLDQWDLTCSTSYAVLVTAAFKSLLSIQTFIPFCTRGYLWSGSVFVSGKFFDLSVC